MSRHQNGTRLDHRFLWMESLFYRVLSKEELAQQSFKYAMFLVEILEDFAGVERVVYKDSIIQVSEEGTKGRQIKAEAFNSF